MDSFIFGIVGIGVVLLLAILGLPIAAALAIPGLIGMAWLKGLEPALTIIGQYPFSYIAGELLITISLFVLMGNFAFESGIGAELYDAAFKWLGRLPGGLALATMAACTAFAGCTGSSAAASATMGTISFPEMDRFNYSRRLSTGTIAAGGTLGILIPPSVMFLIYGGLTETSLGKLFMAGIFPGLLLSGLFLITIFVMCKRNPSLGPVVPTSFSWRERFASLKGVWGMLALFLLVILGLFLGVFTPSEAGAIGAFGAFIITILKRRLTKSVLIKTLKESLRLTGFFSLIYIGAMIFCVFLVTSGFSATFATWLTSLQVSPNLIVILIILMYIPLGMFMETLTMTLLTIPIVAPALSALGFDLIWFGVIYVVMIELGMITPPVGMNVFLIQSMTKVPMQDCFIGIVPFAIDMVVCVAILFAFPQISLFLPHLMT